ncbi:MAG: aldolase/citrate lyase family protein [Anaerolineaceae bacterium]
MNGKLFRQKLHSGERLYGTMIVSDSPKWIPTVSGLGLDFVFIDTEHIANDRKQVAWMCQAYAALGITPVVRINRPDPYTACMTLDGGAQGIIAPYVESPEEVSALVGAVKFRPLKGKRLHDMLEGKLTLEPALSDYLANYNANNSLIVNIESIPALEALDEILAVPGLDAVLVGPHDLTTSLGISEQYHHRAYIEAVDEIIRKSRAHNVGVGNHVMVKDGAAQEIRWAKLGMNLIIHWSDTNAFRYGMEDSLAEIKRGIGDLPEKTSSSGLDV